MTHADTARGVVLDGRYRIEEVIGHGGMSTVYRAHDDVLDRDVAVKIFPPSSEAAHTRRHQSEMHVLARLSHPGLVTLHDAGSAHAGGPGEQTYLVMELVPGPTLADHLAGGPMPTSHVARMGRQLADAMAAVHEAGVVHRDIKPANVLVVDRDAVTDEDPAAALTTGPLVKLADFGIARLADGARLTMTGTTLGTATYLSPEQAAGGEVGPATDVYALGLVLLECLTGEKAFRGTVMEVAAARLNTDPTVPESLGEQWGALLARMTRREAADRISMRQVVVELTRVLGEPTDEIPTGALPAAEAPSAGSGGTEEGAGQGRSGRSAAAVTMSLGAVPRGRSAGTRRRVPTPILVMAVALLGLTVGLMVPRGDQGVPRGDLPVVEGPLGEAIDDLARSVEP
ncbi:serine/threonine-protein kinase [Cellulomonas bogoriensis]|uniref:serine/threonine-protein kinase n=1 Tax=Cellulomonas bogoriensis TaxID=301388 RepID=UPI000556EF26|nr:serine/threonine-protein kinase [Cellulomonas bogoriensis]